MLKDVTTKVIVAVVSGAILLVLGWIAREYLFDFGLGALSVAGAAWTWLGSPSGAPNWVVVALGLGTLVLFAGLAVIAIASRDSSPPEPTFRDFVSLDAFGARWRWDWARDGSVITRSICPYCECGRLALFKEPDYPSLPYEDSRLRLICNPCRASIETVFPSIAAVRQAVLIEIDRIVESGEWREHVAHEKASAG